MFEKRVRELLHAEETSPLIEYANRLGTDALLDVQQHSDLSSIAQSRALPAGYVFRAK